MSYSKRSRRSPSPTSFDRYSRSVSRSRSTSRSRSRSLSSDVENLGNSLYVTGLSTRITKRDLEKHFSAEGEVSDVHLVVDPRTRESRGFAFITMATVEDANRCIKYLNRSVLERRVITVEKARRRRGRTPTPGKYLGLKKIRGRSSSRVSPSYSRSPRYSSERSRRRSPSPYYQRRRDYSPEYSYRRSCSSHYRRHRSYSRSRSPYSRSPASRWDRSMSPYDSRRYRSPDDRYYGRRRHRSYSRSRSPYSRSPASRWDRSVSPCDSRRYRSPDDRYYGRCRHRSLSRSPTPTWRSSRRSYSPSVSPQRKRYSSRRSCSRSYSGDSRSSSLSRSCSASQSSSVVSRSTSPSP